MAKTNTPARKSGDPKSDRKPSVGRKPEPKQSAAKKTQKQKNSGAERAKDPVRGRELKLFLCFALALFALIGCFTGEGVFIEFFRKLLLGVVGRGFYLMPLILLCCGLQYGLVRDKPLAGRILSTLLLAIIAGAFFQLFGYKGEPVDNGGLLPLLYRNGSFGGGVLGGLLALAFKGLFNKVGATIILILLTAFLLMMAAGENLASLVRRSREKQERRAEEWERYRAQQEEEREKRKTEPVMNPPKIPRRQRIDFPLDDPPVSPALQGEYFDREPDAISAPAAKAGRDRRPQKAAEPVQTAAPTAEQTPAAAAEEGRSRPQSDRDWISSIIKKERIRTENSAAAPAAEHTEAAAERSAAPAAEPERPAFEPHITESISPEAEAVLAEDKAARDNDKAETIQAKAEMVADIEESVAAEAEETRQEYVYPPLMLLASGTPEVRGRNSEELTETAKKLSATIQSFGIPAKICDLTRGPSVTLYEVELEQGVKLTKLTGLADDIALALGVSGVRIAPIPDKSSIVGIEVPNKTTTTVFLKEIIDRQEFRERSSDLAFAVGKDIGGNPVIGDIDKLTHLLIAGTTGSGKSVCMNSLILSLLYKSGPEQVRLIMIDPKMIELGIYNGIPQLLVPVVTDPKKAAGALQWAVMEMMRRYRMIADSGTRDLNSYNKYAEKHAAEGVKTMPRLVILIDELADLMLVAAKDVEESICRIAQMGRAAGIHIVIATQRPSADVITGLMKANIPSRIAFAVDSALNSRIILDTQGAEKLLGKGDMLYAPIGVGKPVRVQGTFVTDKEREDVVDFIKGLGPVKYDESIQEEIDRSAEKNRDKERDYQKGGEEPELSEEDSELDELYEDAVDVVLTSKQASVSMLQRRLKLGYTRAARIVDQMEERGVVGPFEGSKPRTILITQQQWDEMRGRAAPLPAEELPAESETEEND